MPAGGIIALLPVQAGREEELRRRLNRIGNDVRGRRRSEHDPHIDFPGSATLHFARLTLLPDPARGSGRERLLLVTDHDGSAREQIDELWRLTTGPEAIWELCEGCSGPPNFAGYVIARTVQPQAYYRAFDRDSLLTVRARIARRVAQGARACPPPAQGLVGRLHAVVDLLWRLMLASGDALAIVRRYGLLNGWMAARAINATLNRVRWIRVFNWLTRNRLPSLPHFYTELPVGADRGRGSGVEEPKDGGEGSAEIPASNWEGVPREDLVTQNQLTLVTSVRPGRLRRLLAVLATIEIYARRLSTPGSLVGISTIHTVRWAVIDDGLRLILASNYDNTWENYIDEFAEMILSGLDAIWGNCAGFPRAGARDVAALKHFLRHHQAPANVFYSAVPEASVLNILDGMKADQAHASAGAARREPS